MQKNVTNAIILTVLTMVLSVLAVNTGESTMTYQSRKITEPGLTAGISATLIVDYVNAKPSSTESIVQSTGQTDSETNSLFSDINKEWLARAVYAENGNQGYLCQVKTAKVILNRYIDSHYPDSIEAIISAPNQFSVYSNGCMWSKEPTEETYAAIEQAIAEIDANPGEDYILYFNNAKNFDSWATFAYQIGGAYFYYR